MPRLLKAAQLPQVSRTDLHEMAVNHAVAEFDRLGEVTPTWVIAAGPHVAWFETPWEDEDEKDMHVQCLRALMRALGVHTYSFTSPMWQVLKGADPEQEEGRDFVLIVATFDRDGGFEGTRFKVTVRRPIGPNFLGPRDDDTLREAGFARDMWNVFDARN